MPEDQRLIKDRGSIVFARPTESFLKVKASTHGHASPACCLEGCFAALLGHPGNPSDHHFEKKPLGPLPKPSDWSDVPADKKYGTRVNVGSAQKEGVSGWENQDAALACIPFGSSGQAGTNPLFLLAVFDGHGRYGHEVSRCCTQRLPGHLSMQPEHPSKNPGKALEMALKSTDADVYTSLGEDVEYSGSTAAVVLLDPKGKHITIANVGDSRVVLGHCSAAGVWSAIALTSDLKPDIAEERERIELSGGVVATMQEDGRDVGPPRVWDSVGLEKPGLACSRSLGDGCARTLGVIPNPVISSHRLQHEDKFLLIATDGLWDALGNDQAVQLASRFIAVPDAANKALIEAVRRAEGGSLVDDTTVVFVVF